MSSTSTLPTGPLMRSVMTEGQFSLRLLSHLRLLSSFKITVFNGHSVITFDPDPAPPISFPPDPISGNYD